MRRRRLAADAGTGLTSRTSRAVQAPFVVHTRISTQGQVAAFRMTVAGRAGASRLPDPAGQQQVFSYVGRPAPAVVGFEPKAGILAFAVTATPSDTRRCSTKTAMAGRDGNVWHSHWVVLQPDAACGRTR